MANAPADLTIPAVYPPTFTVRVPRSGLNDWLFTKGAGRVGGFTVKVLERRANGEAA